MSIDRSWWWECGRRHDTGRNAERDRLRLARHCDGCRRRSGSGAAPMGDDQERAAYTSPKLGRSYEWMVRRVRTAQRSTVLDEVFWLGQVAWGSRAVGEVDEQEFTEALRALHWAAVARG